MNFVNLKKIDGEPIIVNSDYIVKMIPLKGFTEVYLDGEKKPIKVIETKEVIIKNAYSSEFMYSDNQLKSLEDFKNNQ